MEVCLLYNCSITVLSMSISPASSVWRTLSKLFRISSQQLLIRKCSKLYHAFLRSFLGLSLNPNSGLRKQLAHLNSMGLKTWRNWTLKVNRPAHLQLSPVLAKIHSGCSLCRLLTPTSVSRPSTSWSVPCFPRWLNNAKTSSPCWYGSVVVFNFSLTANDCACAGLFRNSIILVFAWDILQYSLWVGREKVILRSESAAWGR